MEDDDITYDKAPTFKHNPNVQFCLPFGYMVDDDGRLWGFNATEDQVLRRVLIKRTDKEFLE